jgi:hypothetical protein
MKLNETREHPLTKYGLRGLKDIQVVLNELHKISLELQNGKDADSKRKHKNVINTMKKIAKSNKDLTSALIDIDKLNLG